MCVWVCGCVRERERRERRKVCEREKGKKEAKEEREGDINGL